MGKSLREYAVALDDGFEPIEEALRSKGVTVDHDLKIDEIDDKILEINVGPNEDDDGIKYRDQVYLCSGTEFIKQIKRILSVTGYPIYIYFCDFGPPNNVTTYNLGVSSYNDNKEPHLDTIVAWELDDGYIYISGKGKEIVFNENSSHMFDAYYNESEDFNFFSEIHFNQINTSYVKDMSYMFRICDNLYSLDVSKFNTSNVENMEGMFLGCCAYDLNLSSFDTSKVKNMTYMFTGILAPILDLSNFNLNSLEFAGGMFAEIYGVQEIIAKDWTYITPNTNCDEGYDVFTGCYQLHGWDSSKTGWDMCKPYQLGGYFFDPYFDESKVETDDKDTREKVYVDISSITSVPTINRDVVSKISFIKGIPSDYDNSYYGPYYDLTIDKTEQFVADYDYSNEEIKVYYDPNVRLMVKNAKAAFRMLRYVKELDLTMFDFSECEDFSTMFSSSSNLQTIYCNDNWLEINPNATYLSGDNFPQYQMFFACTSLTGYNENKITEEYAKPISLGGYFTPKSDQEVIKEPLYIDLEYFFLKQMYDNAIHVLEFINKFPSNLNLNFDELNESVSTGIELDGKEYFRHSYDIDAHDMFYEIDFNGESNKAICYIREDLKPIVTNAYQGFGNFPVMGEVDIRCLDFSECEDFEMMFSSCQSLETIYCNDDWTELNPKVLEAYYIFDYCPELPDYDWYNTGGEYAKPISQGGYFTPKED